MRDEALPLTRLRLPFVRAAYTRITDRFIVQAQLEPKPEVATARIEGSFERSIIRNRVLEDKTISRLRQKDRRTIEEVFFFLASDGCSLENPR